MRTFQQQFNLTVDGVVGKATWYRISYIYAAVRKLAELKSIGQIQNLYSGEWPGTNLREGSKGVEVQLNNTIWHPLEFFTMRYRK